MVSELQIGFQAQLCFFLFCQDAMADDGTQERAMELLATASVTYQVLFTGEAAGAGTYAEFEAALPLPWSTD